MEYIKLSEPTPQNSHAHALQLKLDISWTRPYACNLHFLRCGDVLDFHDAVFPTLSVSVVSPSN